LTSESATTDENWTRDFYDEVQTDALMDNDWSAVEEQRKREKRVVRQRNYVRSRTRAQRDNDLWEHNQLSSSSSSLIANGNDDNDDEFDEDHDSVRVELIVNEIDPPFLRGMRVDGDRVQEHVRVVKDESSDIAKVARLGSKVVRDMRDKEDRAAARQKFWLIKGTKMGAIVDKRGAEQHEQNERVASEQPEDFRRSHQYASSSPSSPSSASSSSFQRIDETRHSLPIYAQRDALVRMIREHPVTIVVGETGSGKTTQLPQYLLELAPASMSVACTQPRRVAAMSVAKRVAEERRCALGAEVGYKIRFEDCTSASTRIKFMTDGVLLRESIVRADLDDYAVIIMDEAHERSLNTDILFGVLKRVLARRRDLRLVVTSATMDADRFAQFFGRAPVLRIAGRAFPVDVGYEPSVPDDYVDAAVRKVLALHYGPPGDILVFMTGQADVEATCALLAERLGELERRRADSLDASSSSSTAAVPPLAILPIYSQLPSDLQARIFEPAEPGTRKCIVATNIAETSLTVDGIVYVVDSGLCKLKVYNAAIGMDALQVLPVSVANADQRAGRAGRTGAGRCFRLYSESTARNDLFATAPPEIQRTNLRHVVLLLKSLGVDSVLDFDFMDAPPLDTVVNAMRQLWMLGALGDDGALTALGRAMSQFPLDPPLAKMLLVAERLECADEALTVVAMLSVPTVFFRPRGREQQSDAARARFVVPESDHLTLLHVYQQWTRNKCRSDWCARHFVHAKAMRKVREIRAQLADIMNRQLGMTLRSCGTDWEPLRKSIAIGFFHHVGRFKSIGQYVNVRRGTACHLHPTSALFGLGFTPDYVVYHELVMTSKEYMRAVTAIEPSWLLQFATSRRFFSIRGQQAEVAVRSQATEKEERKEQEGGVVAIAKKDIVFRKRRCRSFI
jgi:pre-mRNA-splicing factor ATP-dependent RNA helicase DHX38/PRP16